MVKSAGWAEEIKGQGKVGDRVFHVYALLTWSRGDDDEDDRLPKVSYHILKEKQLRELLAQHSLNTTGDKNTLIARYQQCVWQPFLQPHLTMSRWSMLYNSNQDKSSKHRQTHEQLRTKLKKLEELGKGRKAVVEDTDEYQVGASLKTL